MHSETIDTQFAALTATLKVLARWAPHTRHDVLGACSPITLDLSVLGLKAAKAPLTADDVKPLVDRAKANIRNVVQQLDRMVLFQCQDRRPVIAVNDVMEKMARSMRTMFSSVVCGPAKDAASLGTDSEYDLTMAVSGSLMALHDQHGANRMLTIDACRDHHGLLFTFAVAPATDEGWVASSMELPASLHIAIHEARHLAEHLDFAFAAHENGITLRRT